MARYVSVQVAASRRLFHWVPAPEHGASKVTTTVKFESSWKNLSAEKTFSICQLKSIFVSSQAKFSIAKTCLGDSEQIKAMVLSEELIRFSNSAIELVLRQNDEKTSWDVAVWVSEFQQFGRPVAGYPNRSLGLANGLTVFGQTGAQWRQFVRAVRWGWVCVDC